MAKKRMFSLDVVDTDRFYELPPSAQALYFQLSMHGDDDGFIGNAKTVQRMMGASDDDLRILVVRGFVYLFDSGVVVVLDWNVNNTLRNDRYRPSLFESEKRQLETFTNGRYFVPQPTLEISDKTVILATRETGEPQHNLTKLNLTNKHISVKNSKKFSTENVDNSVDNYDDGSEDKGSKTPDPLLPSKPSETSGDGNPTRPRNLARPCQSPDIDPLFEQFWKMYPKRREKPHALAEWRKAIKRASPEKIIEGLRGYLSGDTTYAPYPAKWLRQDSWEDGPVADRANTRPDSTATEPPDTFIAVEGRKVYTTQACPEYSPDTLRRHLTGMVGGLGLPASQCAVCQASGSNRATHASMPVFELEQVDLSTDGSGRPSERSQTGFHPREVNTLVSGVPGRIGAVSGSLASGLPVGTSESRGHP